MLGHRLFIVILWLPLIFMLGCSQDKPEAIWNPDLDTSGAPEITGVDPDGTEFFEDMEITITGTNFSANPEANKVYFDNERARVFSSSPQELVVQRPLITGDSITIKVVVNDQVIIAKHSPYKIEPVIEAWGKFTSANLIYSIAVDKDENVYAFHKGSVIYKITPENEKSEYAIATSARADDIRIGPGGALYFPGKIDRQKTISRIPAGGGAEELVHATAKTFTCLDFDANGELYALGKKSGLWHINVTTGEGTDLGVFDLFNIYAMKFADDALYVMGNYSGTDLPEEGFYKAPILADGTFGPVEALFDWANAGDYRDYKYYGFTLSENKELVIGTDHPDPVMLLDPNGAVSSLYATLMVPNGERMIWGNGAYIYMLRGSKGSGGAEAGRIYRIRTTKKGVPYYGRQ